MPDLITEYLRLKYGDALPPEYLEQRRALIQDALNSYSKRSGKVCLNCKEFKTLTEFGSDSSRQDGLAVYCRQCRR